MGFLSRQVKQVHCGGLYVLLQKSRTLILIVLAMSVLMVVRALRPLFLIRFGPLRSERIGHFAGNTEMYLCERDAGMQDPRSFDIFYHTSPVCNQQLKKMWHRTLYVWSFAKGLDRINRRLPGWERHVIPMPSDRDIHGLLTRTQPHLSFTTAEEHLGQVALRELGIPEGDSFVCFCVRDPAYLDAALPGRDWSYHNYRDSSIQSFVPAVYELARRGYFVIRMGAVVKEALNTNNPMIIDYATNGRRNDFLDIYLAAKCRFFLLGPAGIETVPMVFRRPRAYANFIPLEVVPTWGKNDLFIPKKLWLRGERRFLTFREIFDLGAARFVWTDQYEQAGIEVLENTPEEIMAVAVEMDERLNGTWRTTEDDEELQQRFWSLFPRSHLHGAIVSRIGADFLRQNRELLY